MPSVNSATKGGRAGNHMSFLVSHHVGDSSNKHRHTNGDYTRPNWS